MSSIAELRRRFEQQNNPDCDTSPPSDRGRSPGLSAGQLSTSSSPRRPLSTVRTSFVIVERNGQQGNQLGLRRETGGEPSLTKRRTSFSIDEQANPQSKAERKQSLATEMLARKLSAGVDETIPEIAVMTPLQTPAIEEEKQLGKTNGTGIQNGSLAAIKTEENKTADGLPSNGHTNGASKLTTGKIIDRPAASKFSPKPSPISTAKTDVLAKSSPRKSPLPKTPTTPKQPRTRDASTNTPEKKSEVENKVIKKPSGGSLAQTHRPRPSSKPPTTGAHGPVPKTKIPPSPPQTGFSKPKPKSLTRPVHLPASLTAHTASSGSKTATGTTPPRKSVSRASGTIQSGSNRPPSRATAITKTGIARNLSTKGAISRPALGPPPAHKNASRASIASSTAPADEGFLARMMRPTTASASKTAEKPATPPKRSQSVKRPITRDGIEKRSGSPVHKLSREATPKEATPKAVVKPLAKAAEIIKKKDTLAKQVMKNSENSVSSSVATASTQKVTPNKESKVNTPKAEAVAKDEPVVDAPREVASLQEPVSVTSEVVDESPAPVEHAIEVPETIKEQPIAEEKAEIKEQDEAKEIPAAAQIEPEATKDQKPATPVKETAPVVQQEQEDEEDAKTREEVAKLNAEFAKVAMEGESESKA